MPNHAEQLAQELNLSLKNVQGAIDLIDAGNTIPFIARYRKEATGSMDDQVLRNLGDRLEYLRGLDKRKEEVTGSILGARPAGLLPILHLSAHPVHARHPPRSGRIRLH